MGATSPSATRSLAAPRGPGEGSSPSTSQRCTSSDSWDRTDGRRSPPPSTPPIRGTDLDRGISRARRRGGAGVGGRGGLSAALGSDATSFSCDPQAPPPSGSGHAGRPADRPGWAAPAARPGPRPARHGQPGPIRPAGRPLVGGAPRTGPQGDPATSSPPNRPRMGGRTSLNRSAKARSPTAKTWTTNAPVVCMAAKSAEVGSSSPSTPGRLTLGDQHQRHRQPGPARQPPSGPDRHRPPAAPHRRAGPRRTAGTAKAGRPAPDPDRLLSAGHASSIPHPPRQPTGTPDLLSWTGS